MRAIAAFVFFLAGFGLGCSPDLERAEGSLSIQAMRLPAAADVVRATVRNGDDSVVAQGSSASVLLIERVPAGVMVEVTVEALENGTVRGSKVVSTVVSSVGPTSLVVDFGVEPPIGEESYSAQAQFAFNDIDESMVTNEVLTASVLASAEPSFTSFLAAARADLGRDPVEMRIDASSLMLLVSSVNANEVRDVVREPIELAIASSDLSMRHVIGTYAVRPDGTSVSFTLMSADRASLAAFQSLLVTGNFRLVLSGPTGIEPVDMTQADLLISVSFSAFAPAS